MWQAWDFAVDISLSQLPNILERNVQYNASSFFEEQLTAFEVWLKYGGEKRPPPEQVNFSPLKNCSNSNLIMENCLQIFLFCLFIATYCTPSSFEPSTSIKSTGFIGTLS